MEIKILKNGKISKTSLKNIDFEKLDYSITNDIGVKSFGILRLCVFSGSFRKPKFSHYEYYLVKVVNDNYTYNTDYCTYSSIKHRFTLEVLQVINGNEKKEHDKFTKRGKNLYGNYYEIKRADNGELTDKHQRKSLLKENEMRFDYV